MTILLTIFIVIGAGMVLSKEAVVSGLLLVCIGVSVLTMNKTIDDARLEASKLIKADTVIVHDTVYLDNAGEPVDLTADGIDYEDCECGIEADSLYEVEPADTTDESVEVTFEIDTDDTVKLEEFVKRVEAVIDSLEHTDEQT